MSRDEFIQVASTVPFDNTGTSGYTATDVQQALQDLRNFQISNPSYTATTLNGTLSLLQSSTSYQFITGSATGYSIKLADATTLFKGRTYILFNTTAQTINIKNYGNTVLTTLAQNSVGYAYLQDDGTANGTWVIWQVLTSTTASGIINYNLTSQTAFTTTSTTDVVITGFTLTPQAGTYACWYNAKSFHTTTPKTHWWSFYKNGSKIVESERSQDTAHSSQNMTDTTMAVATFTGSETIDVRIRAQNGSLRIDSRTIILIRLGT